MGLFHSTPRIKMPLGAPPCVEDPHHHAHVQWPDPVPGIPDLDEKVKSANDYVEREFQALIAARYKMKDLALKTHDEWKKYGATLEEACNKTYDGLSTLASQTAECEDAQQSALPNLFEKRDKGTSKSSIKGCAKFKNEDAPEEAGDCKCAAGSEHDGCRAAKITSDHTLLCNQLRKRVLPKMALWRATSPGGGCYVDAHTSYNQDFLGKGEPRNFELKVGATEESMPPLLLALPLPPRQPTTEQHVRRQRRAVGESVRSFL